MTNNERVWLEVSYEDRNAAKAAGARWDRDRRSWYALRSGMTALERWIGRPPLPDVLPGEDRSFGGNDLYVDLIPQSCWFINVRCCIDRRDWDRLRRMVYRRAHDRCEICGAGRDPDIGRWLEAHERWDYEAATYTQRLKRIICLCSFCHAVTHFGFASIRGRDEVAVRHLMHVNGWSSGRAMRHVSDAYAVWQHRSRSNWALDLSMLEKADITAVKPFAFGSSAY